METLRYSTEAIVKFLKESNKIEGEYSDSMLYTACRAWSKAVEILDKKDGRQLYPADILDIHHALLRESQPDIAGKIRDCDVWIGGHKALSPDKVRFRLEAWCNLYSWPTTEADIKAAHVDFEKIHPFADGNGRTGRILMNIQRLAAGLPLLIIHEGAEQQEYYKWFK